MSLNLRPRQTDDDGDAPIVLISSWHREDQFKSNLAPFLTLYKTFSSHHMGSTSDLGTLF